MPHNKQYGASPFPIFIKPPNTAAIIVLRCRHHRETILPSAGNNGGSSLFSGKCLPDCCQFFYLPGCVGDFPRSIEQSLECGRVGGLKTHHFARHRMVKTELEGVERQASQRVGSFFKPISPVSHDGVSQVLHVYADLVFPTRFQVEF